MPYRLVDHTAELQLELEAPTRAALFEEAVLALGELLAGDGAAGSSTRRLVVTAGASDDPALLAAWIDEVVFLAETQGLVPLRAADVEASDTTVSGAVTFAEADPRPIVKAVTYHDLQLAADEAGVWHARAVLDV